MSAPPPPVGLPKAAPPPPGGLPGGSGGYAKGGAAPAPPMALPKGGAAGKAPAAPSGLPGGAPPPPGGLPGRPKAPSAPSGLPGGAPAAPSGLPGRAPAAPSGLPGASKAPSAPTGLPGGKASSSSGARPAPPPPLSLPVMGRAGPAGDASVSAPPPPIGLPGGFPKPGAMKAPAKPGAPPAPSRPSGPPAPSRPSAPPAPSKPSAPPAPGGLPGAGGYPSGASPLKAASPEEGEVSTAADDEDREPEVRDDAWKQLLEEVSDDEDSEPEGRATRQEVSDSGEDSDGDFNAQEDRHKNDMDVLLRQQSRHVHTRQEAATKQDGAKEEANQKPDEEEESPVKAGSSAKDSEPAEDGELFSKREETHASPSASTAKKKQGFMSRLSSNILGKSSDNSSKPVMEADPSTSMLKEDISEFDDAWYGRQLLRLQRDGVSCTKVATNGKPYERRIHVDSRNLTIEVRGGRTGANGVLLDDLVDVRRGLSSPEFEQFCKRFKKDAPPSELADRALVLQTPHRTFSFLLPTVTHRGTVAYCILYLLKSKNRGVMAQGGDNEKKSTATPSTRGPKEGFGSVVYPNRSRYEGNFHNYMRHGSGTLTLSDGTKYESEWRTDERHGDGKEVCPDGTTFIGSYVKGMRHGHGVMTWPEGSKYSGQFERGRANGEGELLRTDGSVYRGQFSEDCMSGEGKMQWRDGVEYVGQFVGNRREGFGRMHWTSGRWKSYEGYWKDGLQHGEGTLVDHNNQEFRGVFRAGKLERWDDDV